MVVEAQPDVAAQIPAAELGDAAAPAAPDGGGGSKSAATAALESAMTATAPKAKALSTTMTNIPRLRAAANGPAPQIHKGTLASTA